MTASASTTASIHFLDRPGGRIAYTDEGSGPLVVMAPGFGDLKEEYRFLAPELVAAGYRAVTMDLRGHGQSSVGWDDHGCAAMGGDMLALVAHLAAGPAILVGNSISGGSAAWAAAEAPDAVAGLVLIDPFARNVPIGWWKAMLFKAVMHTAFVGPWAPAAWGAYYASLYPTTKPADFADYKARLVASLKQPGRMAALQAMMRAGRDDVEPRLAAIRAPSLVVMGSRDPDFDDPAGEAATMAGLVRGKVAMIDGAGHYPHAEMPAATAAAILAFLAETVAR
jgi:pimeloyl-ACP methyl ester carboxylesterase